VSVPKEKTLSALVPAAHAPHAATVLRSLGRRGVHTVAVYERPTPAFSSRYCDETRIVPSPSTDIEGYRDALLGLAARNDVRTVVPLREADAYVLAKHRSEFGAEVTPLWPSSEMLQSVHDRIELARLAREASVATPETRLLDGSAGLDGSRVVKARYPLITTEYIEEHEGTGVREAKTVRYLDPGEEPDLDALRSEMGHVPLVQEYVPGEEYAFWALYRDGNPVATCQKHQIRGESYAGGTSVYRETVRVPALEAAGRALLDRLDWHGFASVQFKRDARTGEFTLLEVNPRVWVSVACPVRAGIDFPYYYWQLANGEPVTAPTDYETEVGTHRIAGELMYLMSVVNSTDNAVVDPPPVTTAVSEVLESVYRQPHFDYLEYDDPAPFVRDIADWVGRRVDDTKGTLRRKVVPRPSFES
jgi:predicted ATP-grasp superfamily ATP-dependent carboligase